MVMLYIGGMTPVDGQPVGRFVPVPTPVPVPIMLVPLLIMLVPVPIMSVPVPNIEDVELRDIEGDIDADTIDEVEGVIEMLLEVLLCVGTGKKMPAQMTL